jgi:glutamine cyclotransferase
VTEKRRTPREAKAEIVREYGPFASGEQVAGVTFDGKDVWVASGEHLQSFDPESGSPRRSLPVVARQGTAFDGRHLYQLAKDGIQKIVPETGEVVACIPAPPGDQNAGLTWAEGTLWLGQHRPRKILQIDPKTGRVLRTIDASRYVTGVSWVDGELWHGTWEDDQSDLRRIDPDTGEVLERLAMPEGAYVTGLESDGKDLFFCGGGPSGTVRAVRRPRGP